MRTLQPNEMLQISGGCSNCINGPLFAAAGFVLSGLATAALIHSFSPETTELKTGVISGAIGIFTGILAFCVGNFFDRIDFHYIEVFGLTP